MSESIENGAVLEGITVRDTLSGGLVTVGEGGKVGLYVCGPTVYNHIHIGMLRSRGKRESTARRGSRV